MPPPTPLNRLPCTPCTKTELDLNSIPPTQVAIVDDYVVSTGPRSSLDGAGPLEFELTASGEDYLDLSRCYLRLRLRVRNDDGSDLASFTNPVDGENAGKLVKGTQYTVVPSNLLLHTLFRQVEFSLNDTLVTSSNDTYPYRAYLTTLLSYGENSKKTFLNHLEFFYWDDAGEYDLDTNQAIDNKNVRTGNSTSFDLVGRLHIDMCMQGRLIPNNVGVRIILTRSKPEFYMMSHEANNKKNYEIVIEEATLEARRVKLSASEQLRIEKSISTTGARFPITHVVTKHFTVSSGASSIELDSLFSGQIPNKIVMGFVRNDAFNGSYRLNPFNFQHFNLTSACLIVDGRQVPTQGMHCDFKKGLFTDLYRKLMEVTTPYPHDWGNSITRQHFSGGSTLLAYDLTPDGSGDGVDYVSPRRHGNVKASLRFSEALGHTISIIVLGQFDNTVVIDRNRSVIFDYTG